MQECPNCGFTLAPDGVCPVCGYPQQGIEDGRSPVEGGSAADRRETAVGRSRQRSGGSGRIPLFLGIGLVLVLGAVGAFVVRKAASRTARVPVTRTSSPPSGQGGRKTSHAIVERLAGSATPQSSPRSALAIAHSKAPADPDGRRDKASEIAAKYENNPQYQIPVGASPVDVRAVHPINLYVPPRDPMYNIAKHIDNPPTNSQEAFVKWMLAHTPQTNVAFLHQKWRLAQIAIANHALTHKRVLNAFLLTPREWFVRRYNLPNAYEHTSLPIGYGQTITNPGLVIHMTNALDPQPNQKVLEIGTGSGYQSAILSELSNHVFTIEIVRPLGAETNQIYLLHTPQMPQYANIHRRLADGYYGWPKYAPFDRIIVTTGIDHIPPELLKELKPGGIMLIPVGPPDGQTVLKVTKSIGPNGQIQLKREDIFHGFRKEVFVPFTAAGGGTHNTGGLRHSG